MAGDSSPARSGVVFLPDPLEGQSCHVAAGASTMRGTTAPRVWCGAEPGTGTTAVPLRVMYVNLSP